MSLEQGGALFLDISTQVGWAYGTLALVQRGPEWGVWVLPKHSDIGLRMVAFSNELAQAIEQFQPAVIGIEAALPANQQSSADTAELLIGLGCSAAEVATRWERAFVKKSVNELRREVCGRSQRNVQETDDRIHVKDAIVKPWIEAQGWNISDHNARDAAIGWAFLMGLRAPKRQRPGSLL